MYLSGLPRQVLITPGSSSVRRELVWFIQLGCGPRPTSFCSLPEGDRTRKLKLWSRTLRYTTEDTYRSRGFNPEEVTSFCSLTDFEGVRFPPPRNEGVGWTVLHRHLPPNDQVEPAGGRTLSRLADGSEPGAGLAVDVT